MTVNKRDGTIEEFSEKKIFDAIKKANNKCHKENRLTDEQIDKVVKSTKNFIGKTDNVDVDAIHKCVENALMKNNCFDVAKQYILFRQERDKERFKKFTIVQEMKEKLDASNVQNQNANLDEHSFGGRKGEMDSAVLKQMALDYYISPKFAKNHINNRIYIHDLDSYVIGAHNCLSLPLDELLKHGANTRQAFLRPAGSINTAFQLMAVYFQIQSLQQFGGVAATHVDWSFVPYIRKSFMKHFKDGLKHIEGLSDKEIEEIIRNILKEKEIIDISIEDDTYKKYKKVWNYALEMTEKECRQAAEGAIHNCNSLQSRSGNQLPFSSINYGTCTLIEGRMVTKAILDATITGVGNGQTSIFPCQIFQKMKGVNDKGSPNYDLYKKALKSTAKRMYPNYCNCDWTNDANFNDADYKNKFIESLTESQKQTLISKIQENPELGDFLGLDIVDD